MGRCKRIRKEQTIIKVSLDRNTALILKGWKRSGANISKMVRFCITQTFPVITTPEQEVEQLRKMAAFHTQKFEQQRADYERIIVRLQLKADKARLKVKHDHHNDGQRIPGKH